jgi:hypothetical protein
MLEEVLEFEKIKPQDFQVLFLRNDSSQTVEVHEVKEVDFLTIQERLDKGESVFITSKTSQKIKPAKKPNGIRRSLKTKLVTAFYSEPL